MPKHWTPELEKLKAATRVLAGTTRYHTRTPSAEAWCGVAPPEEGWNLIPLLDAEENMKLQACYTCFSLGYPKVHQERLSFEK